MKYSVIIPTMWHSELILEMLRKYEKNKTVQEIIIIDNRWLARPKLNGFKKLKILHQKTNIFVNPAWNLGVSVAKHTPILANDDILIDRFDELMDSISNAIVNEGYDLIGASVNNRLESRKAVNAFDGNLFPAKSFGCFMVVPSYIYIPDQFRVYSGDNILFYNAKKVGIIGSGYISSPISTTIKKIQGLRTLTMPDRLQYKHFMSTKHNGLNILIRTSGRKNYFRHCIASVRKYAPGAKLHIILDNPSDYIDYVAPVCKGLNMNYYFINQEVLQGFYSEDTFKPNRPRFWANVYFNVVFPFLHPDGHVFFLDDDDMLVESPPNTIAPETMEISKVAIHYKGGIKVVPSVNNFGKAIVYKDISSSSVVLPVKGIPKWGPNKGGDFDFVTAASKLYKIKWVDKLYVKTQTGANHGRKIDRKA